MVRVLKSEVGVHADEAMEFFWAYALDPYYDKTKNKHHYFLEFNRHHPDLGHDIAEAGCILAVDPAWYALALLSRCPVRWVAPQVFYLVLRAPACPLEAYFDKSHGFLVQGKK